jgi:hypothetical protein
MQFSTEEVNFIEDQKRLFSLKYRKNKLEEEISNLEEEGFFEDIGTKLDEKKTSLQKIEGSIKKQKENLTWYKKALQKKGVIFRIEKLARKYRLNQQEQDIICCLLFYELGIDIGEKYSYRYSLNGRDILRLIIGNSTRELLQGWNYFGPRGRLIQKGLVIHHRFGATPLGDEYQLSEQALTELLGKGRNKEKPGKKPKRKENKI